jgi:Zn-dependent membrane protease YugP
MFLGDNLLLYAVLAGVPLLLGIGAQAMVSSTFRKYSAVAPRNGMTGNDVAAAVLRASGLPDVSIHPVAGHLSDHYDPRNRTLNLSESVGQASSLAAAGVAAHEAGHALQDAAGYAPMRIRQTLVPVATIGSQFWIIPVIMGFIFASTGLVQIGIVLLGAVVLFQLVTLPVEFDASRRALVALEQQNLLAADEIGGARKVLTAAALTYVAGFIAALGQLVYLLLASRE